VVLASRDASKLEATKAELETRCAKDGVKATLSCITLDLNDQGSVRKGAAAFGAMGLGSLDLLINNAGVMALKERKETAQGLERQVGVNHVGHFLLTKLLMPHLKAAKDGSRVICLSSSAYRLRNQSFPYNEVRRREVCVCVCVCVRLRVCIPAR
jgi:NAD(P)-dependent dehydrogenase (short-subunit alcohol dehydrogenase family)